MAKAKELRYLHSQPITGTNTTGVATIYADLSGVLKIVRPGGETYFAGQTFTQILSGNYPGAVATGATGNAHNAVGNLGATTTLFVVQGPSGAKYGIPAYLIS